MNTQNFDNQRSKSSNSNYIDYGSGFLNFLNFLNNNNNNNNNSNNAQNNIPINTNTNINDCNPMNSTIYGDLPNQISKFDSYSDVYNRVVSDPSNITTINTIINNNNGNGNVDLNYNMNMEQLQYLDSVNNNNNNNPINLQNMSLNTVPVITNTPSNSNIPINSTMLLQQPTLTNINDIQINNTNIHNNLSSRNYIAVNDFNNNSNNNSILPFTSHNINYSIPKTNNNSNTVTTISKVEQNSFSPIEPTSPSSISTTSTKNKDRSSVKRLSLIDIKDLDSLTNYDETQRFKYGCSICDKRFKRPSSLKTHINIHTGFKPFICPYIQCNKSFNAKSNMLRHYKLHFKLRSGAYILPDGHISMDKPTSKQLFNNNTNVSSLKNLDNIKGTINKKTIVENHQ